MRKEIKGILAAALLVFPLLSQAESWELGGHIKDQPTYSRYKSGTVNSSLGPDSPVSNAVDLRLNAKRDFDRVEFNVNGELLSLAGDGFEGQKTALSILDSTSSNLLPDDDRRLLRLTKTLNEDEKAVSAVRLDRLYLGYTNDHLVLKVGRQAVSWGNGLAFSVLDPFNPFSPTEIDRDYKKGDDMLYGQWLFNAGEDLQFLVLPRRNPETGDIEEDQSSVAFKLHGTIATSNVDYDLLAARHFGENLAGFGLSRDFFEALWRLDAVVVDLKGETQAVSVIANVDRSWTFEGINIYGFAEYFFSGVGTSREHYLDPGNTALKRVAREELFTLGRNYLASGFRIELTPLLNIYPSNILNLADKSGIFQLKFEYSLFQNFEILTGVNLPYGKPGSEFGGLVLPAKDLSFAPPLELYCRTAYYF